MRRSRSLAGRFWIPGLLACVALALLFVSWSDDAGRDAALTAQRTAQDEAPGPLLEGNPSDPPAQTPGAGPARDGAPSERTVFASEDDAADAGDGADDHLRNGEPLTESHPLVSPVVAIQERHTKKLMENPLVVGTATGMNERGEIAVVVLTKAPIADLPRFLEGAPVMQFVSGELFASRGGRGGGGGGGKKPKPPPVDPTARFPRPVPIGVSTGHPDITAGTIGCRVTDGSSVWAMSNNHVYANENDASQGDAVIQPGTFDGGASPADDIGTLDQWVDIDFEGGENAMDVALASTTVNDVDAATPPDGYGLPKTSTYAAAIGLRVRKYGRTTGQTNGRINAINATVNVGYDSGIALFVDQLVITPGSFSAGGDSGSLVVVQKGGNARRPVALLFAGSSSATIASPIGPILSHFGVTIDGN